MSLSILAAQMKSFSVNPFKWGVEYSTETSILFVMCKSKAQSKLACQAKGSGNYKPGKWPSFCAMSPIILILATAWLKSFASHLLLSLLARSVRYQLLLKLRWYFCLVSKSSFVEVAVMKKVCISESWVECSIAYVLMACISSRLNQQVACLQLPLYLWLRHWLYNTFV